MKQVTRLMGKDSKHQIYITVELSYIRYNFTKFDQISRKNKVVNQLFEVLRSDFNVSEIKIR